MGTGATLRNKYPFNLTEHRFSLMNNKAKASGKTRRFRIFGQKIIRMKKIHFFLIVAGLFLTATGSKLSAQTEEQKAQGKAQNAKGQVQKVKAQEQKAQGQVQKAQGQAQKAQGQAQEPKMKSPAATATGTIDGVNITINYSQPAVRGRKIMGELVPYGKVWRTGANATSSIEFSDAVKIDGKTVAKGKYGLYTIPGKDEWTIMLNKDIKWGSDEYTEKQDVVRVKSKPAKTAALVESFTISVENNLVVMRWENTEVSFKVSK